MPSVNATETVDVSAYEIRPASIPLRWLHRGGGIVLQYAVVVQGHDGRLPYQRVEWVDVPDVIDEPTPPT